MKPDDTTPIATPPAEELQAMELQEETLDGISGGLVENTLPNPNPEGLVF